MGTTKRANGTSAPTAKAPPPNPFPDAASRDYSIAAVDRTLDLLESLSRLGPASLAALADSVGCTRTAAFRLLRTLQGRGFTIQDEARGLWRLGARWNPDYCTCLNRTSYLADGSTKCTDGILISLFAAWCRMDVSISRAAWWIISFSKLSITVPC